MQQFREVSRTRTIYSTETHTSDLKMPLVASQLGLSCNRCDVIQYYMTWTQTAQKSDNMWRPATICAVKPSNDIVAGDNMCRERPEATICAVNVQIYILSPATIMICPATIYATTAAAYCLGLRVTTKRNSYTVFAVTVTASDIRPTLTDVTAALIGC